jgi:type IV pilus assembly protein PilV
MTRTTPHRRFAARGFTLVEVMVALIIIGIGMLGIAKMQGLALSSTGASRSRALAAIEASSLAAAMQANRSYWSSTGGTVPVAVTVTTSAGTAALASTTASMQTALGSITACGLSMGTTPVSCYCTPGNAAPCVASINVAASDLYDWAQNLANFLPNATASVSCNPADQPEDCTIYIQWNETAVTVNAQEASAAKSNPNGSTVVVSYSLYVVP